MFFLFSWIWSIVVFDAGPPPAVGEAANETLARKYIDIVRAHTSLKWAKYDGAAVAGHTIQMIAEVRDGTVYETLLADGTKRITLLVGEYLQKIAEGLTHFEKLYNAELKKPVFQSAQQQPWKDCVSSSTLSPNRHLVLLDATAKTELRKTVSVTDASIAEAMKKAGSTTAVLHFVNSGLETGSGQEPAVRALYVRDTVIEAYQEIKENSDRGSLLPAETAIVRIEAKDNTSQANAFASYVLANAAPEGCRSEALWSVNVDSVISAIGEVLQHETGAVTVFLGAHGCGIFGNDPKLVAKVYYSRLYEWLVTLSDKDRNRLKIIFPIPIFWKDGKRADHNLEVFQEALR